MPFKPLYILDQLDWDIQVVGLSLILTEPIGPVIKNRHFYSSIYLSPCNIRWVSNKENRTLCF